jgi:hypothetical protein
MNAKRAFYSMVGFLVVLTSLGIAAILVGNKVLSAKANKLVNLKLQDVVLNNQETALQQAQAEIKKYSTLNTIAESIVPQDKDQAGTVREIVDFAGQTGIKIGSITFPASNLGGASGLSSAGSGLSQVQPVKGISGLYQLPITVQSDSSAPVSFNQLITFLQKLENNRHTAQVSQVTITPTANGGDALSFGLVINVFIKP